MDKDQNKKERIQAIEKILNDHLSLASVVTKKSLLLIYQYCVISIHDIIVYEEILNDLVKNFNSDILNLSLGTGHGTKTTKPIFNHCQSRVNEAIITWYKIFKSWGVQNLIFPSDDLFLNKNTDFCWKIPKIFKSWGVRTPWSPHP